MATLWALLGAGPAVHAEEQRGTPDAGVNISTKPAPELAPEQLQLLACQSCHATDILSQQRLTAGQWEKVLKKMLGWGALLDEADAHRLVEALSASRGNTAPPYSPPTLSAKAAAEALEPLPDGPFSGGKKERGLALYQARCLSCHGVDAHGLIGVNLTDRPILYRAAEFAEQVKKGRGRMPPAPDLKPRDVGDLLAYLRTLPGVRP
jgi:mono/diheme cytochrome c family protein